MPDQHFDVYLTDTRTGEQRVYHEDYGRASKELDRDEPPEGETMGQCLGAHLFIWTDGNFDCDCNRALFFRRANNEEDEELTCNVGLNIIRMDRIIIRETGRVVYDRENDINT